MNFSELFESIKNMNLEQALEISKHILKIDPENLEPVLSNQAHLFFFFTVALAKIKKEYEFALAEFGRTTYEVREEAEKNPTRKTTEKYLEIVINSNDRIIKEKKQISELENQLEIMKGLLKSLEHRRDMIVQMSSNKRAETKLVG